MNARPRPTTQCDEKPRTGPRAAKDVPLGASPTWLWEALGIGAMTMAWLFLLGRPRRERLAIVAPVAVAIGDGALITVVPALYTVSTPVAGLTTWLVQFLAPLTLVCVGALVARRARLTRNPRA